MDLTSYNIVISEGKEILERILKVDAPGKIDIYAYDGAGNRIAVNETYNSLQPSG